MLSLMLSVNITLTEYKHLTETDGDSSAPQSLFTFDHVSTCQGKSVGIESKLLFALTCAKIDNLILTVLYFAICI